jgi:predicted ATP-binding protein involved in virulence
MIETVGTSRGLVVREISMRIHRLTIQNFKCFEDSSFDFTPEFNVLAGDNGSGKSAVLDALAIGIGAFLLGIDKEPARSITSSDVRLVSDVTNDIPTVERKYPVRIGVDGTVNGNDISWHRSMSGDDRGTTRWAAVGIQMIASDLQRQVREQMNVTLPIIAYYGTGRMWYQSPRRFPVKSESIRMTQNGESNGAKTVSPGSRLDGYEKCLSAETNKDFLTRWLKTVEIGSIQRQLPNPTLEGIKQAVARCMKTWTTLIYDVLNDELVALDDQQNRLPIRLLSDGQRNVLFTVLDIAYRASVLNPHLRGDACTHTPGVVLIDEIDLHLHPKWQRRVVGDLRKTFPQIQFIVSTHSPQVIQSLRDGELIDLHKARPGEYAGRSPEDILENVMDVDMPQRSERSLQMIRTAEEYYRLLRDGQTASSDQQINQIKQRLDELSEPFADNEAYVAFLRQERLAAGL